jgi:cytidylate kinase
VIIAVDGPAASGKGTLARRLAAHYGLAYLDTGRTYRAVAAAMMAAGRPLDDVDAAVAAAEAVDFAALDEPGLASPEVGEGASRVAVIAPLREVLVRRQREFADRAARAGHGAVLDGRDIGTVVLPDAPVKLFVTASVEERARRRALEVYGRANGAGYRTLLDGLRVRDARDEGRAVSPLRPAPDAHVLDTTAMDAEAAFAAAARLVDEARRG